MTRSLSSLLCELSFAELYAGQSLFDNLYTLLTRQGFCDAGNLDSRLSPLACSILQANVLFVWKRKE